ncbi:MAG: gluconate 2-dehydrogenase subunit 3 family protein [Acidobacteriota bacterium]|nr:MAG: gluconate 2-dehydrogenase subunit 3 family protein [Acidobacteriota bacterium]
MADEKNNVTRRDALKGIAVGLGTSLPVLNTSVAAQQNGAHGGHGQAKADEKKAPYKAKYFKADQMALIAAISELIIPTDDHSPGAIAAEVPEFIDLMISESPAETKQLWTDGLAAMDILSQTQYQKAFNAASSDQQTAILTEVSKNEMSPKTLEERFFRAIKGMTIDGYYTSKIGIHQELQYKGNTYLKEFKGCTHPEHQK